MSRLTRTMRRYALLALPVLAAVGLLVAGCGNYSEKNVSPLPRTVVGSTTASGSSTTSAATATKSAAGDPAAGKTLFSSAGCSACHTLKDAGASGAVGPNLDTTKPAAALVTDRVANGKGTMPGFKGRLSDSDIANVAAYVSSVAGK